MGTSLGESFGGQCLEAHSLLLRLSISFLLSPWTGCATRSPLGDRSGTEGICGEVFGPAPRRPPPPVPALTCHPSGWPSTVAAARALRQSSTLSEHQPLLEGLSPHTWMDKPGCGQDVSQVPVTWMQLVLGPDLEDR